MSNGSFLPKGYTPPKTGGDYTKLQDGDNLLRILSAPLLMWVDWDDNTPIRTPYVDQQPAPASIDPAKPCKHTWAMIVYNYGTEKIEIWEVHQSGVQNTIEKLASNPKWGSPFGYDIIVNKSGQKMLTKYQVFAEPKEPVSDEIKEAYKAKPINLKALLSGGNPFESAGTHSYDAPPPVAKPMTKKPTPKAEKPAEEIRVEDILGEVEEVGSDKLPF
jgi:hypothetical protein